MTFRDDVTALLRPHVRTRDLDRLAASIEDLFIADFERSPAQRAERLAVIHVVNLYGDDVLHDALDEAGLLMRGRSAPVRVLFDLCCELHVADGQCCDPDDCGPCCAQCPTCPTLIRQRAEALEIQGAADA